MGASSKIITTSPRLGLSAAQNVPSSEGMGMIRASSFEVPSDTGTRAPPSVEVLAASLSGRMVEGSASWGWTSCHSDLGRSLGVSYPLPCAATPLAAT